MPHKAAGHREDPDDDNGDNRSQHHGFQTHPGKGGGHKGLAGRQSHRGQEDGKPPLLECSINRGRNLPRNAAGAVQGTEDQASDQWAQREPELEGRATGQRNHDEGNQVADGQPTAECYPVKLRVCGYGIAEVIANITQAVMLDHDF